MGPVVRILIIGYGNLARTDDGLGPAVVHQLAQCWGTTVQGLENPLASPVTREGHTIHLCEVHQLDFGLGDAVAQVDGVLFVDAHVGGEPFEVAPVSGDPTATTSAHSMAPQALLALAEALYSKRVEGRRYTARVEDLSFGEGLSADGERCAAALVERIQHDLAALS